MGADVSVSWSAACRDGARLGPLTRILVEMVHALYATRAEEEGAGGAAFVGQGLGVQRSRCVIDRDVDEIPARSSRAVAGDHRVRSCRAMARSR